MKIETIYIIESHHNKDYDNVCFTSRKKCEDIIKNLAEEQYGKPVYSEDSEEVKLINSYWCGDISLDEVKDIQKENHDDAMFSALYYDYIDTFYIKELKVLNYED